MWCNGIKILDLSLWSIFSFWECITLENWKRFIVFYESLGMSRFRQWHCLNRKIFRYRNEQQKSYKLWHWKWVILNFSLCLPYVQWLYFWLLILKVCSYGKHGEKIQDYSFLRSTLGCPEKPKWGVVLLGFCFSSRNETQSTRPNPKQSSQT